MIKEHTLEKERGWRNQEFHLVHEICLIYSLTRQLSSNEWRKIVQFVHQDVGYWEQLPQLKFVHVGLQLDNQENLRLINGIEKSIL